MNTSRKTPLSTMPVRYLMLVIAFFCASVAGVAVASKPGSLYDALLQRPQTSQGTVIVPDRFLREWDPVTVFYTASRGTPGPEPHPERLLQITPAHPGAYTWLDARTLQFRPAEPWPALSRFQVSVGNETLSLATLTAPPLSTEPPAGASGLDSVETLTLTFPTRVPLPALEEMLRIELSELPGIGANRVQRIEKDAFEIKELPRTSASSPASYAVNLHHPIPLGTRVQVILRLSIDEDPDASLTRYSFATATPFRPATMGCSQGGRFPVSTQGSLFGAEQVITCATGTDAVAVEFSSAPENIDAAMLRNLVRFDPAVDNLDFELESRRLVIRGDFASETLYAMRLVPVDGLVDRHDRPLEIRGESIVHVTFPHQAPFLKWTDGDGIVERYGPKRVPASGRGHSRADLRIYKVDPDNRSLWPFPDAPLAVNERSRPPGPGEAPAPWTSLDAIPRHELAKRVRMLGSPAVSTLVPLPVGEGGAATFGLDLTEHLAAIDGENMPGHYLVGLRRLDEGSERSWVRVQVTDLVLTTFEEANSVRFMVSSYKTGRPVSGTSIRIEGRYDDRGDRDEATWKTHFSGQTGDDGSVTWKVPGSQKGLSRDIGRITLSRADDVLVLDPERAPDHYADNHWHGARDGWLSWAFSNLERRSENARTVGHLFTDRPIYRPKETVHLRGYVRTRDQGRFSAFTRKGRVRLTGPGGETRIDVNVDPQGNWSGQWEIADAPTGQYYAVFESDTGRHGEQSFQVEAYELPTFETSLHAPIDNPMDTVIDVKLTASYFAGGRVSGRPVRWRISQYPLTWRPSGDLPEGFVWSSDGRWSGTSFRQTGSVDRQTTTDDNGQSHVILDPTVEPTAMPRTYIVEATVTGADDQTITTSRKVRAVPAFVVGIKAPRYLESATRIRPQIALVDSAGEPIAGKEVSVTLKHRAWHSHLQASDFTRGEARYVTDVVDEIVHQTTFQSGADSKTLTLPVEASGVYVVEVSAADDLGRAQQVSVDLYVRGETPVTWDKPKAGVFSVSADKDRYAPGDRATLVIQSPYQTADALVVVEEPTRNRYYPVRIQGGTGTFSLAIEEGWVPRLPVHVVLRRGRRPDRAATAAALDLGKPETIAATRWLSIAPVENQIDVTLTHPEQTLPGEKIPVDIHLATPDGRPLSGEVTLWLVDQAVLTLAKEARLDPLPDLITSRKSRLSVRDTRNLAFGRIPYSRMPGGDDWAGDESEEPLEKAVVRKNFKAVPYYRHDIPVDSDGHTRVEVQLPDNLTVFKVRAKATSGTHRFGVGTSEVRVRLPLLVQPALPRFVRATDTFEAAGIGRIVEGPGGAGAAQISADGATIDGDALQRMTWDPTVAQPITWSMTIPTPPLDEDGSPARDSVTVKMGVSRTADGASDAFEAILPLQDDRERVSVRTLEVVAPGKPVTISAIPEAARPGSIARTVLVADAPELVKTAAALDFLEAHPGTDTWGRLDSARARVATQRLRNTLGQHSGQDALESSVQEAQSWLSTCVNEDTGLIANWPGHTGRVHLSAYAVLFLVEAEEAGFSVDSGLKNALLDRLERALRSDYAHHLSYDRWWARSLALQAVIAGGRDGDSWLSELSREQRDADGLSQVLLAASRAEVPMPAVVSTLESTIRLQLNQGTRVYGGITGFSDVGSPLIQPSEARLLGDVTRALHRNRPDSEKLPYTRAALVSLGREDGWGSTNANAAAILALSEQLESEGSGTVVTLTHGSASDRLTLETAAEVRHMVHGDALTVTNNQGEPVAVLVTTSYLPAAPGSEQRPVQNGFVVSRSWSSRATSPPTTLPLDEGGTELPVAVGDVVEEAVTLIVPEDMHYVELVVPLAAGMEPLNPRLSTAPAEARPAGQDTRAPAWASYLDDRVLYAYESLPKGTYHVYFRTRATTEGRFVQPAATARKVYEPQVYGTSAGARVKVTR